MPEPQRSVRRDTGDVIDPTAPDPPPPPVSNPNDPSWVEPAPDAYRPTLPATPARQDQP